MFDRVLINTDGLWRATTEEEFSALPLEVRIRHVIKRTVVFQINGEPVEPREALAMLRRQYVEPRR